MLQYLGTPLTKKYANYLLESPRLFSITLIINCRLEPIKKRTPSDIWIAYLVDIFNLNWVIYNSKRDTTRTPEEYFFFLKNYSIPLVASELELLQNHLISTLISEEFESKVRFLDFHENSSNLLLTEKRVEIVITKNSKVHVIHPRYTCLTNKSFNQNKMFKKYLLRELGTKNT